MSEKNVTKTGKKTPKEPEVTITDANVVKTPDVETVDTGSPDTVGTTELVPEETTPKPPQALVEYADFWNKEIYGHYKVTAEQAKRFFELYNQVFNANKRYTGCGSCLIRVQKKLYNEAKKFNLVK